MFIFGTQIHCYATLAVLIDCLRRSTTCGLLRHAIAAVHKHRGGRESPQSRVTGTSGDLGSVLVPLQIGGTPGGGPSSHNLLYFLVEQVGNDRLPEEPVNLHRRPGMYRP